jgi:hypothetical protein
VSISIGEIIVWLSACDDNAAMSSPRLARWIPAFTSLRVYNRSWLRSDVLTGITLAAHLIPAALGDASLANEVTVKVHGQP